MSQSSAQFRSVLSLYNTVGLKDLDSNFLMERRDDKYFFHADRLEAVLNDLKSTYNVLEIGSKKIQDYFSLYFDTQEYKLYKLHHNQRKTRQKFRFRKYEDTGDVFFEIKNKSNKNITSKLRIDCDRIDKELNPKILQFIMDNSAIDPQTLEAKINIRYNRFTLVKKDFSSRITIDTNLTVSNKFKTSKYLNLVILEHKHNDARERKEIKLLLAKHKINPQRISKYCLGVMSLEKDIKKNLFKKQLTRVQKIENERAVS